MKLLLVFLIPAVVLLSFGASVLFWTAVSQLRFLSYFKARDRHPPALGATGWIDFYKETLLGAYTLLWWSLRAAFQAGPRRSEGVPTGRPILCVHGLFMNSSCMWGIRQRLESRGRPTRGVFMGVPLPTPMVYVRPLARVMKELAREHPDEGFDIVAHSIGGVMIREVFRQNPELADMVHRIVTLGSPHHGTAVVRWIKFGPIYSMLSLRSTYLRELGDLQSLAPRTIAATVGSLHDLVVYPIEACHLDGANQVTLETISHLGLLTQDRVLNEVERALAISGNEVG
jgi:pimeloyl-ACP methyl ester carboxylesterase